MADLYKKYSNIFNYANTIIYNILQSGKMKERFKQISMDYADIKQEIYIEILKILKEYEEKYENIDKVYLERHIKDTCGYVVKNLLRNKNNQIFVPISSDLQQELEEVFEKIKPAQHSIIDPLLELENTEEYKIANKKQKLELLEKVKKELKRKLIHPDLIPTNEANREQLTDNKILDILNTVCDDELDIRIAKMTFLDGLPLRSIRDMLNMGSRGGAYWRLNKITNRLKKKYKNIEQLFDTQ